MGGFLQPQNPLPDRSLDISINPENERKKYGGNNQLLLENTGRLQPLMMKPAYFAIFFKIPQPSLGYIPLLLLDLGANLPDFFNHFPRPA